MAEFPKINGKAVDFSSIEVQANDVTYTAFENISWSQPVEESFIYGTAAEPLARTRGQLQGGEGTLEFSHFGEAHEFIDGLGDADGGYLEEEFEVTIKYRANPGDPIIKHELIACRATDTEMDHSQGSDGLGVPIPFSFLKSKINGRTPLKGQR